MCEYLICLIIISVQPTNDALVQRLFSWAEKSQEPLQTYATGLLAAAMEVQDIAASFRCVTYCMLHIFSQLVLILASASKQNHSMIMGLVFGLKKLRKCISL